MKELLLKEINNYFNKIMPNENDSENLINTKEYIKGDSLLKILVYLVEISDPVKNLVILNFEKVPEIYADVVSSINNPNCSCRNRVYSYFSSNFETCKKVFLEILQNNQILENDLEAIKEMVESYLPQLENNFLESYGGKIIEIQNNQQDYFNLIKNLRESGYFYQGISIVENDNKIKLYFY